jgi:hypothetical protein
MADSTDDPTNPEIAELVAEETWEDNHHDKVVLTLFSDGHLVIDAEACVELNREQVRQMREWLLVHSQP